MSELHADVCSDCGASLDGYGWTSTKRATCFAEDERIKDPIAFLMRVHYEFFMANPYFWSDPNAIEADSIICILASNLRLEGRLKADAKS